MPFTDGEKLRVQFRKSLRKGYVRNAQLDPEISAAVHEVVAQGETFIVRVDRNKGGRFWFSDHRVLFADEDVREILRYEDVRGVHWMFKDLRNRIKAEPQSGSDLKRQYFDRLEIELADRLCVLDGLSQAYSPLYHFFGWILKSTQTSARPAR